MLGHSLWGFSGAHRWMKCPGSIKLIYDTGLRGETSPFAEEGTKAHTLAERCLKAGLVGVPVGEDVPADMRKGVELYLRTVWNAVSEGDALLVEHKFSLNRINGELRSTFDAAVYGGETLTVHVFDLKYGAGVPVEVNGNAQLLGYLLGAADVFKAKGYPVKHGRVTIVQPRFDHPDGPVRTAEVSRAEMLNFEMELEEAFERTLDKDAPLNTGAWCKFCPARAACPAIRKNALAVAATEFEVIEPGDVKQLVAKLSPEEISKRLKFMKWLKLYASALYGHAMAEAGHGRIPPDFKLIEKQGRRKWINELEARKQAMGACGTEALALKTPAQIEKLISKKTFEIELGHLVETKSSGVKLVPLADKGKALTALEFEPINTEEDEDNE